MTSDFNYGVCGVFCEQCPVGNGLVNRLAKELKRLTSDFSNDFPDCKVFNFREFDKALNYFSEEHGCPGCQFISEAWCDVRKCEKVDEVKSCLLCDEFRDCPRTEYQRGRYPFVLEHYDRVREVGLEGHFEEEREKAEKGLLLNDIRKY